MLQLSSAAAESEAKGGFICSVHPFPLGLLPQTNSRTTTASLAGDFINYTWRNHLANRTSSWPRSNNCAARRTAPPEMVLIPEFWA
jgi:hypothetical protein